MPWQTSSDSVWLLSRHFRVFELLDAEDASRGPRIPRHRLEAVGIPWLWLRRSCHRHRGLERHRFNQADGQGEDPRRCDCGADPGTGCRHSNDYALRNLAHPMGYSRVPKWAQLTSTALGPREHFRGRPQRNRHELQGRQDVPGEARLQLWERNRHRDHCQARPSLVHAAPELLLQGTGGASHHAAGKKILLPRLSLEINFNSTFFRKELSRWPSSRNISRANVLRHVAAHRCSLASRRKHVSPPITFPSCMAKVSRRRAKYVSLAELFALFALARVSRFPYQLCQCVRDVWIKLIVGWYRDA